MSGEASTPCNVDGHENVQMKHTLLFFALSPLPKLVAWKKNHCDHHRIPL